MEKIDLKNMLYPDFSNLLFHHRDKLKKDSDLVFGILNSYYPHQKSASEREGDSIALLKAQEIEKKHKSFLIELLNRSNQMTDMQMLEALENSITERDYEKMVEMVLRIGWFTNYFFDWQD